MSIPTELFEEQQKFYKQLKNYTYEEMKQLLKNKDDFKANISNISQLSIEEAILVFLRGDYTGSDDDALEILSDIMIKSTSAFSYVLNAYKIRNENFKKMVSQMISNILHFNQPVDIKLKILSEFLYTVHLKRPNHNFSYNLTPLYFTKGLEKEDNNQKFFKYDFSKQEEKKLNQSEYFWKQFDLIPPKQKKEFKHINHNNYTYRYLMPSERAPFYEGPVALLFAGGSKTNIRNLFANELNCCLFSHHLREMGYSSQNIVCFIEDYVAFSADICFYPFGIGQVQITKDKVLCPIYAFHKILNNNIIKGAFNNSSIFKFSVIKTVMDAKGPVVIYYSNQGNSLIFPYPPYEIKSNDFLELCSILNSFEKQVLFILDSCESYELINDPEYKFEFIHFITSSQDQTFFEGTCFSSTKDFIYKDPQENLRINFFSKFSQKFNSIFKIKKSECQNKKLHLSSQFFRYFMDSIYSINNETTISQFVQSINHENKNIGFKAQLITKNDNLPISTFLISPPIKYIDYIDQEDNYQPEDIEILKQNPNKKMYLLVFDEVGEDLRFDSIVRKEIIIDENIFEEEEEFIEDQSEEEEIYISSAMPTIQLTFQQVKIIIDETINYFGESYANIKKFMLRGNLPKGIYVPYIYSWFRDNFEIDSKSDCYASKLNYLYLYAPTKKDEILIFILNKVDQIKGNAFG